MGEQEPVRPLSFHPNRISRDEEEAILISKNFKHRKCIKCFGCCTAVFLVLAVVITVLALTVFHVKDPDVRLNGTKITQINWISGMNIPDPTVNITVEADVLVKNPNVASFRYKDSTTTLLYHGNMVGEAKIPSGQAKARRTKRMNVTVEMITERLLLDPRLPNDIKSGLLTMGSYTRLGGRVKILGLFMKHVTVKMNCTMTVNLTSQQLQDQKCTRKVSF